MFCVYTEQMAQDITVTGSENIASTLNKYFAPVAEQFQDNKFQMISGFPSICYSIVFSDIQRP